MGPDRVTVSRAEPQVHCGQFGLGSIERGQHQLSVTRVHRPEPQSRFRRIFGCAVAGEVDHRIRDVFQAHGWLQLQNERDVEQDAGTFGERRQLPLLSP